MAPEVISYVALAFILGIVVAYLVLRGRTQKLVTSLEQERHQRSVLEAEVTRIPSILAESDRLQGVARALEHDLGANRAKAERIPILEKTIEGAQRQIQDLRGSKDSLEAELRSERDNFDKLKHARLELANEFEKISNAVLSTNRESFLSLAQAKLGQYQEAAKGDLEKRQQAIQEMVTPLQTKIKDFELKVDEVYRTEAAERNSLRGEIKNLVELNQKISKEASNLALALKGDTKKQGNWGELILEKVLEYSGLRKGEEYRMQVNMQGEDGQRLIPDAIIFLPEKKHILIDAKVSLVAYDRYVSSQTDEERSVAVLEHIASVKRHIKELSDKKYPSLPDLDSPDFTLLFMPIESSFGLAIQADNELFGYAWDRKIVIVSPSTLLATLRTISSIWKQERQTKNALDIADRAGKMYDKFVGFVDDLLIVGKRMSDAKSGYDEAMKKLSSGPGNLVRQSEQLKEMGAKATKQLSASLLDRAGEASEPVPLAAGPEEGLFP